MTNIKASQDVLDYCKSNNYELVVNIEDKFIVYKNNDYYYFFIWDSRVVGYENSSGDIETFCMGHLLAEEFVLKISMKRIDVTSDGVVDKSKNKMDN